VDSTKINPFILSTVEVLETMFQCTPRRGQLHLANGEGDADITAVIGISGGFRGVVAISLPAATAEAMTRRLLSTDKPVSMEEVADAAGELANMVAGCAKAKFTGPEAAISLPTVVRGASYHIEHPCKSLTLVIPFQCELGGFAVKVTFEEPASRAAQTGAKP
jgi:chemotaxis protein CheX